MPGNTPAHLISSVSDVSERLFPMVFEVPPVPSGAGKFEFTLPGSKKPYSIPLMKHLKPTFAIELAQLGDTLGAKKVLDEFAPGAFEKFQSTEQLTAFLLAWRNESGIGLGESSASSSS